MISLSTIIIDDNATQREILSGFLKKIGCHVETSESGEQGIEIIKKTYIDVVITDFRMDGMNGLEVLQKVKEINPEIQVVILTAFGTIEDSVKAIKNGAWDYLSKPVDLDELEIKLKKISEHKTLIKENEILHTQHDNEEFVSDIVYSSDSMQTVLNMVARVSDSQAAILIQGESGTGKEIIAKTIHKMSQRNNQPFIVVNCAAIPEALFESELFGREKGAFTGAHERCKGRFEIADGGTLFLDEVADIPYTFQVKLLRFLQEKEFNRLGSTQIIKSNVRIISATNLDIQQLVAQNKFRSDLYFRLNVIPIHIPALRHRREDIPLLIKHFIAKHSKLNKRKVINISAEGLDMLMRYDYPGNVRELENIIERAVILARSKFITQEDLPLNMSCNPLTVLEGNLIKQVELLETSLINNALKQTQYVQTQAADNLGISERTLRYKIAKYNIKKNSNDV